MPRSLRSLFSVLFFLSGMAGLIYEVCWTRLFVLPMGNTIYSLTAVLTAFMAGLALGAFLAGRWIDRRGHPLRVYAFLEAGIGVFCFVLPWLVRAEQPLFRWVYQSVDTSFLAFHLFKFFACGVIVLVPATLMGATLPVLCRSFMDEHGHIGRSLGWLYAVNAFGAVAGSLITGFVLIPELGLRNAMFVGVATSLAVAAIAWLAQARLPSAAGPVQAHVATSRQPPARATLRVEVPATVDAPRSRALYAAILVGYGLSGLAAMLFQIAWTRVLALVIGSSVYAFALLVSAFILGLAVGASAAARFADRLRNPTVAFAVVELGIGFTALAMVPVFQRFPDWMFQLVPQLSQSFGRLQLVQFGLVFVALLLPTACMGMCLPLVGKSVVRGIAHAGEAVGTAYSANTLGTILGAFLGGFVFLPGLGIERTILSGAALNFAVAIALLALALPRRRALPIAAAAGVAGIVGLVLAPHFDPATLTSGSFLYAERYRRHLGRGQDFADLMRDEYSILLYEEGLGSTITVKESTSGARYLAINGKVDASDDKDMATQVLSGQIAALLHPAPRDVAVIGLASGVTLHAVAQHPSVRAIDCIEIVPEMKQAARFFDHVNGRVLDDPRLRLIVQDGRNHLTLTRRTYDLIVSEPSNPWMAGIAALYTREFLTACRDRLEPRGVMAVFLHLYSMDVQTFRNIVRTFQSVFPSTSLWETAFGADYLLTGARDALEVEWDDLSERLRVPAVASDLARVHVHGPAQLLVRHLAYAGEVRAFTGDGVVYSDDRNRLEFDAPRLMHHRTGIEELQALQNLRRPALPAWVRPPAGGWRDADREALAAAQAAQHHLFDGIQARIRGRDDGAMRAFLQGMACDPWIAAQSDVLLETSRDVSERLWAAADTIAATGFWETLVQLNPDYAEFQNQLGMALGRAGRIVEAESAWRHALALQPRNAAMRANLGLALARQGKVAEAEAEFRTLLTQRPNDVTAHLHLARLAIVEQDLAAAEKHCANATIVNPGAPDAWLLLGEVLMQKAAYRPAVKALQIALAQGAPEQRTQLLLAECYSQLGEGGKAGAARDRARAAS